MGGRSPVYEYDMAQHNIRINCVCPAPTETDLAKELNRVNPKYYQWTLNPVKLGRPAKPEEIAASV